MKFNYLLGRDIVEMRVEERWGENVINQLSMDLKKEMPTTEGLSVTNLRYCRRFYLLYSQALIIHPQVGGELEKIEFIQDDSPIFQIPWGHHKLIMDKVKGNLDKAFFFISQTIKKRVEPLRSAKWDRERALRAFRKINKQLFSLFAGYFE